MKAVITEIRQNTAVLLSDDGRVFRRKNKNYKLGQEIDMNIKMKIRPRKIIALAAAACFVLFLGLSVAAYYVPITYVSLDVNPSIEYGVNRFDRVVSVKGVNDDGTEIINEIDISNLKNKSIDEAIAATVNEIAQKGYLDKENAGIVISASSSDMEKAGELAQELSEAASAACRQNNCSAEVCAEAVGKERVEEARALGVTPGKLNLVKKLQNSSENPEEFDINEWLTKSVAEIMSQTKQNKEQVKNQGGNIQNQNGEKAANGSQEANQEKNKQQEANSGEDVQNQEKNQNHENNGNNGNNGSNGNNGNNGKNGDCSRECSCECNGECSCECNGECSCECNGECSYECSAGNMNGRDEDNGINGNSNGNGNGNPSLNNGGNQSGKGGDSSADKGQGSESGSGYSGKQNGSSGSSIITENSDILTSKGGGSSSVEGGNKAPQDENKSEEVSETEETDAIDVSEENSVNGKHIAGESSDGNKPGNGNSTGRGKN